METAAALTTLGAGYLGSFWGYNRECYQFDRTMQQAAQHQRQSMRKEWVFLFRDDINQMVNLTITRMDNYILLNSLEMALLFAILGEGTQLAEEMPTFSAWVLQVSFAGATAFLLLSTWLCVHASLTAHACGVSILLQSKQVRDLATGPEIDRTRFRLQDFEQADWDAQLRVPFSRRVKNVVGTTSGTTTGSTTSTTGEINQSSTSILKNVFKDQKQPYHYGPDTLENFFINERAEERSRNCVASGGGKKLISRKGNNINQKNPLRSSAAEEAEEAQSAAPPVAAQRVLPVPKPTTNRRIGNNNDQDFEEEEKLPEDMPRGVKGQLQVRASHLNVFRVLQRHWQYFDAYARVCNAIGTYMLVDTTMYFILYYMMQHQRQPFLAWAVTIIFLWLSRSIALLDLVVMRWENQVFVVLKFGGPLFVCLAYHIGLHDVHSLLNCFVIPSTLFSLIKLLESFFESSV